LIALVNNFSATEYFLFFVANNPNNLNASTLFLSFLRTFLYAF
jgi:hypothetical protein